MQLHLVFIRVSHDKDVRIAYDVNGERYGPFPFRKNESSVEHVMRVPAIVLRRQAPISVSISIDSDGIETQRIALEQVAMNNLER